MATNDIRALCGSAFFGGGSLEQNREWIRNVGQDLYDTHGSNTMQEVFFNVKAGYPTLQMQLSKIWDGVGDWAD